MRDAFLEAAESVLPLLSRPEVARSWGEPSVLPEWSVGGLAGHLASQLPTTARVLATSYTHQELIPLLEHYHRAAWVTSELDDDVNVSIREGGDAHAADGPEALVAGTNAALVDVRAALLAQPRDRVVVLAWQGWALTLDDFLVTRMMEIAVHSDDLAATVAIDAPVLSANVLEPVLQLLTGLAVRRHGQAAMIRALSRSERAPSSVAAF